MIADILRSQANTLGQSIKNANDGIAIVQTADKAINEQSKILDTIKTKATQSAQDSQTLETRKMIQKDIEKLILELDNIASTTSFNGQALLAGQYINKKFQIGANSNETISVDINATNSEKIGHVRFETGAMIRESSIVEDLKFKNIDGMQDLTIENIIISHTAGTGIGVLAEAINKNSDKTGVKASWTNKYTTVNPLGNTNYESLELNGISIGAVENIKDNDSDGKLVNAINEHTDKTGIIASIDTRGHVEYKSIDGRGMSIKVGLAGNVFSYHYYGRLTLTKLDATNIDISATSLDSIGFNKSYIRDTTNLVEATVNLGDIKRGFTITQAEAMGMFTTDHTALYSHSSISDSCY
jgi:flagellin